MMFDLFENSADNSTPTRLNLQITFFIFCVPAYLILNNSLHTYRFLNQLIDSYWIKHSDIKVSGTSEQS